MSTKIHHFRIGLFVLAGAALFIAALFAVGLKAYFGEHEIFETYVTGKVENLSVGALVKLRGVTIGKVSAIEFAGAEYPRLPAAVCDCSIRGSQGNGMEQSESQRAGSD
jgi:paraquat-inducible protein B